MSKLELALKKKLGYTTDTMCRCADCKFHKMEDGVIDRTWVHYCTRNVDVVFEVEEYGRCNKFERI